MKTLRLSYATLEVLDNAEDQVLVLFVEPLGLVAMIAQDAANSAGLVTMVNESTHYRVAPSAELAAIKIKGQLLAARPIPAKAVLARENIPRILHRNSVTGSDTPLKR